MAIATTTYEMQAMIRGYHVYATVWDAQIGEKLYCAKETGNIRDPYAVRTLNVATLSHDNITQRERWAIQASRPGMGVCSWALEIFVE